MLVYFSLHSHRRDPIHHHENPSKEARRSENTSKNRYDSSTKIEK